MAVYMSKKQKSNFARPSGSEPLKTEGLKESPPLPKQPASLTL